MAGVVSFAGPRSSYFSRAQAKWSYHLFLDLFAMALLLGVLRAWASAVAPKLGMYFTAEALLIACAYFAVVRAVHISARSCDGAGNYRHELATKAVHGFYLGLLRYWPKVVIAFLALLVGALVLDVLTARTGFQHRPNVHISILFVEIMVWARYGAAISIASARWTPPQPAAFASARETADSPLVARSFALTNITFGAVALVGIVTYKWGGAFLPNARAELYWSAALFTALAFLALRLQCRWVDTILPQIEGRSTPEKATSELRQAA